MTNQTIAELIARQNDLFRSQRTVRVLGEKAVPGCMYITAGIDALPALDKAGIMGAVFGFDTFTPDNDPYGEHDFGAFEHAGKKIFWKIDYYSDSTMRCGSEDPADPAQTYRVLTIMLAEEY